MVDRGSLENCCTARYRRFESYILRNNCPSGGTGRHSGLRNRGESLRVRLPPWVQKCSYSIYGFYKEKKPPWKFHDRMVTYQICFRSSVGRAADL